MLSQRSSLLLLSLSLSAVVACSGDGPITGVGGACLTPPCGGTGGGDAGGGIDPNADADGDGIPNGMEGSDDADGDGVPAYLDPDETTVNYPDGDGELIPPANTSGTTGTSGMPGTSGTSGTSGDAGGGTTDGTELINECADATVAAEPIARPVDIVLAIDASCSMDAEAAAVSQNLQGFADKLKMSGLDYHLIVISDAGFVSEFAQLSDPNSAIGLPAAQFRFVDADWGSNWSDDTMRAFDVFYSSYRDFLRQGAVTHLVPVTDDSLEVCRGGLFELFAKNACTDFAAQRTSTVANFDSNLQGSFGEYTLHPIVGIPGMNCSNVANTDPIPVDLAQLTGGIQTSICDTDWTQLFQVELLAAVVDSVSGCSLEVPPIPDGLTLNTETTTLDYSVDAAVNNVSRVAAAEACDGNGGWYFDRPLLPQFIDMCPSTCDAVTAARTSGSEVSVDVTVGCTKACGGSTATAEVETTPLDLILSIDASCSMDEEAAAVGSNVAVMVTDLLASGLDFRLVMISDEDFVPEFGNLLSPSSPTYLPPERLLFIDARAPGMAWDGESGGYWSNHTMNAIADFYPTYSSFLRPAAVTHMLVVTDDDSAVTAANFDTAISPNFPQGYTLHAVADQELGDCGAGIGTEYFNAATATGGETFDICTANWSALFSNLGDQLRSSVPLNCEFDVPGVDDQGGALELDPTKVNVKFTGSTNELTIIPRTTDAAACASGGWFFDNMDDPKTITMCETTCQQVNGNPEAVLVIEVGCTGVDVVVPVIL